MIIPISVNELSIIRIITKLLLLSSIVSSRLGVIGHRRIRAGSLFASEEREIARLEFAKKSYLNDSNLQRLVFSDETFFNRIQVLNTNLS